MNLETEQIARDPYSDIGRWLSGWKLLQRGAVLDALMDVSKLGEIEIFKLSDGVRADAVVQERYHVLVAQRGKPDRAFRRDRGWQSWEEMLQDEATVARLIDERGCTFFDFNPSWRHPQNPVLEIVEDLSAEEKRELCLRLSGVTPITSKVKPQ